MTAPVVEMSASNDTCAGNEIGTIGNNGPWFLSLSRISGNTSTWYYTFY